MTPDTLSRIGQALYGSRWQSELARALGVSDRTMRRWVVGQNPIPDGVTKELESLRQEHIRQLQDLESELMGEAARTVGTASPKAPPHRLNCKIRRAGEREVRSGGLFGSSSDLNQRPDRPDGQTGPPGQGGGMNQTGTAVAALAVSIAQTLQETDPSFRERLRRRLDGWRQALFEDGLLDAAEVVEIVSSRLRKGAEAEENPPR